MSSQSVGDDSVDVIFFRGNHLPDKSSKRHERPPVILPLDQKLPVHFECELECSTERHFGVSPQARPRWELSGQIHHDKGTDMSISADLCFLPKQYASPFVHYEKYGGYQSS